MVHLLRLLCGIAAGTVCNAAAAPDGDNVTHARRLPRGGIVAAYTDWAACDHRMVEAVENGANVLIWFASNLQCGADGSAVIAGPLPDLDCVADVAQRLRQAGYEVAHLMSVGGWNAPHPCTTIAPDRWAAEWHRWNMETVARPGLERGFDGLDWDLEGNDDPASPSNLFTVEVLDLMGQMFEVLKRRYGYLTAMAPAQSYLDDSTSEFSLKANLPPHERTWHPDFRYHGRNQYAYVLAKFGVDVFDLVSVQMYEGWSQANYEVTPTESGGAGRAAAEYIAEWAEHVQRGWAVDFGGVGGLHVEQVRIPASKLVLGLANGWATRPSDGTAGDGKFLLLWPKEVEGAWRRLGRHHPRGAMFWSVRYEGDVVEGTSTRLVLTKELAAFIRPH